MRIVFPMDNYMLHVQESVNLTIYLYAIYLYAICYLYAIYMARNDLRVRGAWGRGREAPPPTRRWVGAKRHPNS